jgi:hypothetical protein
MDTTKIDENIGNDLDSIDGVLKYHLSSLQHPYRQTVRNFLSPNLIK